MRAAVGSALVLPLAHGFRLDRFLSIAPVNHRLSNPRGEQPNRAERVVVSRHDEIHFIRIAIRIDDADDRNLELAGFVDRDFFLLRIDDKYGIREPRHATDALKILLKLSPLLFIAG